MGSGAGVVSLLNFSKASANVKPYHSASSVGIMCFLNLSRSSSLLAGLFGRKSCLARAKSSVLLNLIATFVFKSCGDVCEMNYVLMSLCGRLFTLATSRM